MLITSKNCQTANYSRGKKLDGAEERGETNTGNRAAAAEPEADSYVDEEAGIDDRDYLVEADEDVAGEQREEREEEGERRSLRMRRRRGPWRRRA